MRGIATRPMGRVAASTAAALQGSGNGWILSGAARLAVGGQENRWFDDDRSHVPGATAGRNECVIVCLQSDGRGSLVRAHGDLSTLRLAICGTGAKQLEVAVNGTHAGRIELGGEDGVITRHQIHGLWYERELAFDAGMLKSGENTLALTIPAGPLNAGVIYDYLRLELDESSEN